MYPSSLPIINGFFSSLWFAAFIPAINPCALASSYPEVPFICPAKNKPETSLVSRLDLSCDGGKKSYSMAYPGLKNRTFSKPSIVFRALS